MARVAFVTGGTRGIGRAICERLVADGMKVAAGYSGNETAAEACAKELGVMVVKGNVGSFDDCAQKFVFPEQERACSAELPCRQDFVCARTSKAEVGACVPPYFVYQLRLDGYPIHG